MSLFFSLIIGAMASEYKEHLGKCHGQGPSNNTPRDQIHLIPHHKAMGSKDLANPLSCDRATSINVDTLAHYPLLMKKTQRTSHLRRAGTDPVLVKRIATSPTPLHISGQETSKTNKGTSPR